MRYLALIFSFFIVFPLASRAADNLDQLLQSYSVKTKTLDGLTATPNNSMHSSTSLPRG
jgi:hypothetical protein